MVKLLEITLCIKLSYELHSNVVHKNFLKIHLKLFFISRKQKFQAICLEILFSRNYKKSK